MGMKESKRLRPTRSGPAEPAAGAPVAPTDAFAPPPPPPPPPPLAPVGKPAPPDMFSEVVPAVSIAARNVFGPTVNAIHPPAGMTSLPTVAATVDPPSVTKAAFAPVLYTMTTVPLGSGTRDDVAPTESC